MEKIIEGIKEILDDNGIDYDGTHIEETDSMQYISALVAIEEKFDVEIPESYMAGESFDDIGKLAALIEALQNKKEEDI